MTRHAVSAGAAEHPSVEHPGHPPESGPERPVVGHAPHDGPTWPALWVRALLPLGVLTCLEHEELHGYAIATALGHRGFGVPKGGSLYPVLSRLEDAGEVTSTWVEGPSGPSRKMYALTDRGRARLAHDRGLLQLLLAEVGA